MLTTQQNDAEAIALPLEFELERSEQRARSFVVGIIGFVSLALLMLWLTPFHSVVVAPGALAPLGEPVAAHHDRGGVIEKLFVARGAPVRAGEPLLRLRSDDVVSEIKELSARRAGLRLRIERLSALLEDRNPNLDGLADEDAVAVERRLFEAERDAHAAELAALEAQRRTRLDAADAYEREAQLLARAADALRERRDMVATLVLKNAAARAGLLDAASELSQVDAEIARVAGSAIEAQRTAEELARQSASADAQRRAGWSTALSEAVSEVAAIEEQIARRRQIMAQRTIAAPVDGIVLRLGGDFGAAIDAGGLVAEIVPSDRTLIAEIRIPPETVGQVAIGDEARIYIATYDEIEIGEVLGILVQISPGVVSSPEGESYYAAQVALPEPILEAGLLRPGMTLSANILGAERTVLDYLLSPFSKALGAAFAER